MNAPEFPTSPRDTETKGEVEMANVSSCCVRSGWQLQTWIETESKEILFPYTSATELFTTSIWNAKHAFRSPLHTSPRSTILLEKKKKWRKRLCHGLLYLLSVAEHHSHGYSNRIRCQNTFTFYHSTILSSQITTGYTSGNFVTIKWGDTIMWQ